MRRNAGDAKAFDLDDADNDADDGWYLRPRLYVLGIRYSYTRTPMNNYGKGKSKTTPTTKHNCSNRKFCLLVL